MNKISPEQYDLWKTTPPYDSDEDYIDEQIEKLSDDKEFLTSQEWFWNICIDWNNVEKYLKRYIIKKLEEDDLERKLSYLDDEII